MNKFNLVPSDEWFDYDLKITLKPCFKCNQRCWFCNEWDNDTTTWSANQCELVLNKLSNIPENKQKIFIYMYGGEPTLSKQWEYIQYRLIEMYQDRELFIQTQTNMSLGEKRLSNFLAHAHEIKNREKHTIDICSSYHLNKQDVRIFYDKMKICDEYGSLGLCFFNTEIQFEYKTLREFMFLAKRFPERMKLRFTQLEDLTSNINNMPSARREIYENLLKDQYLHGDDNGESLEYRYFIRKYPRLDKYLESNWIFQVDDDIISYNEILSQSIYRKFKYMKCSAGTDSVVIDHNLQVYRCNDYYYNNIQPIHVTELNLAYYLSKPVRCLSCKCADGLDLLKTK